MECDRSRMMEIITREKEAIEWTIEGIEEFYMTSK